jgi:hypothetical protein
MGHATDWAERIFWAEIDKRIGRAVELTFLIDSRIWIKKLKRFKHFQTLFELDSKSDKIKSTFWELFKNWNLV